MKKYFFSLVLFFLSLGSFAGNPVAMGDIVGRDLNIPGLGWAGHVGMYTGSSVLEVLNANPVIQVNSLTSFKQASPYWGSRYGKGSNFSAMINAGLTQKSYGATYTTTATYSTAYTNYTCIQYGPNGQCAQYMATNVPGKWRCDTFMNYIYSAATGQNIVSGSTILPSKVYNAYPSVR